MSYASPLNGCPLITQATREEFCGPNVLIEGKAPGKGWKPRDYSTHPYGGLGFAGPYTGKLIPRGEWSERIRDREKSRSTLFELCKAKKIGPYHQGSTNYCWMNAPAKAVEVARAIAGQKHVPLSPASGAAVIKNFRNEGGWGTQAVAWIVQYGLGPAKLWPPNAIDRKYNTKAVDAERDKYKVDEWYDLPRRSFDALMTQLFQFNPCPLGLSWWGHEILGLDPVQLGRDEFGVRILNSWGTEWGQQGWAVLDEEHATADDQVACRVVTG